MSDGGRSTGAGSQRALRTANTRRVLAALASTGPMSQAALSRSTGLSTATVSNIVGQLRAEHLVSTSPTTSSGRRALLVELTTPPRPAVAAGIDIGRRHLRIVLATMQREVLAEDAVPLPLGHTAEAGIRAAVRLLDHLVAAGDLRRDDIAGCGVAIPGPIDARTGRIAHGAILPAWVGFRPVDRLAQALRLPVHLDNDANLGALAELTWGPYGDAEHLLYVKVASGIGAGLVLSGQVYRGALGITGEIGHMPISEYGPVCRCGNRGCLEAMASVATMIDSLVQSGVVEAGATTQQLLDLVRAGDPVAGRIVEDGAVAIGQALGAVVSLLNPAVAVIGGPLAPLGDTLLAPLRRGLRRFASPTIGAETEVVVSSLGDRAEALGACALVFQASGAESFALIT
ncbi:MAG: ROK family transcriptional regulator [Austwickia sp.]|nr:ROK family transcriptional regulator [Actinomycetota bacterium]MCB1253088.1 ROK family transcriptional regulator [Austwickia sp.]MCO5309688.1 ROK family transcriptional regulator [Austwickia sp.]